MSPLKLHLGVSTVGQWKCIHEGASSVFGPAQWQGYGIAVICGVGHRLNSDPALLWLWHGPAEAAPI